MQPAWPGELRDLVLDVRYESWDVSVGSHGGVRVENFSSTPALGASVYWWVETGDAYLVGDATSDAAGEARATATAGWVDSTIRAEISFASGDSGWATLHLPVDSGYSGTDYPYYDDPGNTDDPGNGATGDFYSYSYASPALVNLSVWDDGNGISATVTGSAQADVRDVWSGGGGAENQVYSYSYALAWSSLALHVHSGDASADFVPVETDADGNFSFPVRLGADSSLLSIEIEYGGSSASATVDLPAGTGAGTGQPQWVYDRTEGAAGLGEFKADGPTYGLHPTLAVGLSVDDNPPADFPAGGDLALRADLVLDSWELWESDLGGSELRNHSSGPAINAAVAFEDRGRITRIGAN